MNNTDILVPLNLDKHAFQGLEFAARMSSEAPVRTTLLHVVELNIVALECRIYNELCREYHERLGALGEAFFENQPRLSVRIGKAHEQIIAEARESNSELIVMTSPQSHRWRWRAGTVNRVVKNAPCLTIVLSDPKKSPPIHHIPIPSSFAAVTNRQKALVRS